jgi:hypothetical protein
MKGKVTCPVSTQSTEDLTVDQDLQMVRYPVTDLAAATSPFGALQDIDPDMEEPHYVGFRVGGQELGLDPNGHAQAMTGPIAYYHVDDIATAVRSLLGAGA